MQLLDSLYNFFARSCYTSMWNYFLLNINHSNKMRRVAQMCCELWNSGTICGTWKKNLGNFFQVYYSDKSSGHTSIFETLKVIYISNMPCDYVVQQSLVYTWCNSHNVDYMWAMNKLHFSCCRPYMYLICSLICSLKLI
jgi:hypothetical protein